MSRTTNNKKVMKYSGGICVYCGNPCEVIDHIDPWCHSADNSVDNLVPACTICNAIAGGKVFDSGLAKQRYILAQRKRKKWQRRINSKSSRLPDITYHKELCEVKAPVRQQKSVKPISIPLPYSESREGALMLLRQIEAIEATWKRP